MIVTGCCCNAAVAAFRMRSRSIAATSSASLGAADFVVDPTDAIAPAAGFAVAAAFVDFEAVLGFVDFSGALLTAAVVLVT